MKFPVNRGNVMFPGRKKNNQQNKKTPLFYLYGDRAELATTIQGQSLAGHTEYV